MSFDTKLATWVGAGLLSADQAAAISAYERNAAPARRSWALYGIAGVGIAALATGIISLVAANWSDISAPVKLAVYFLVQAGVGGALWVRRDRHGVGRETLLVAFMLLLLAGIGLFAQIYNLHSDGWQGLRFWLAMCLPLTLLARGRLAAHLWLIGFGITAVIWAGADVGGMHGERRLVQASGWIYLFAALGLWAGPSRVPVHFVQAARSWSLAMLLPVGTALGSVLWHGQFDDTGGMVRAMAFPWLGAVVTVCALLGSRGHAPTRYLWAMAGLVVASTVFWSLPLVIPFSGAQPLASAASFMVIWAFAAVAAVAKGDRRLFDAASVVMALRIIVVYFEVFGSLAATGIGLVLSGGVILGVAWIWHRYRDHLARSLEAP